KKETATFLSRFFSSVNSFSVVNRRLKEYSPSTNLPTESIHSGKSVVGS
ncbi:hypothetical protein LINPERHAP1_LOCUS17817, partial [Linum perenne]